MNLLENRHAKDRWVRRASAQNLSTVDAFNLERTLIVCYGRKDIGTGVLVNKNNGIGIDLRTPSTPEAIVPIIGQIGLHFGSSLLFRTSQAPCLCKRNR